MYACMHVCMYVYRHVLVKLCEYISDKMLALTGVLEIICAVLQHEMIIAGMYVCMHACMYV